MIIGSLLILFALAVVVLFLMKILGGVLLLLIAFTVPTFASFAITIFSKKPTNNIFTLIALASGLIVTIIILTLSPTLATIGLFVGIAAGVFKK
jgi:hypothetical protein